MKLFLLFQLGEDLFGLDAGDVQEVCLMPPLNYIPRGHRDFLGAVNLHGQILPVLDLGSFAGLPPAGRDGRIIVLRSRHGRLALAVTTVHRTAFLDGEAVQSYPGGERFIDSLIGAVYADEEKTVFLLDAAVLFGRLEPAR